VVTLAIASHTSVFIREILVVVWKTDEDGEAMRRSIPSGSLRSFGSVETGALGTEEILNLGVFSMSKLERLTISCAREGGKH